MASGRALSPANFMQFLKTTKGFARVVDKLKVISVGNGNCLAEMKVEEEHTNPMGGLHGGLSATLVDMISTYSLLADPKNPEWHVSVDMNLSYLRGAKIGDEIQIESNVIKAGKSLIFMEVDIRNKENGATLVKAKHTKYFVGTEAK